MQTFGRVPSGRKTPYGLGWFVRDVNKIRLISHGGNTAGFFASLFRVPSANLTITLMGNVNDLPGDQIAQKVTELYVPELRYKKLAEQTDADSATTARLLTALKSLGAGTPDESLLDPEYIARLKTGRGQMGLRTMARFKDLPKLAFLEKESDDPDTLYRYRASIGEKAYLVLFTVTKDGKVFSVEQREE